MADPRARAPLGRTGLTVTRLGVGTAPLGGLYEPVSDGAARAVVERAWDLGLRLFDTAPLYGSGLSETRVGAALGDRPRGEFVLSTKVGRLLRRNGGPDPVFAGAPRLAPVFDFSYDATLRSLDESLARLGLDRVDVALIHDPDDHFEEAISGAYRALERLRGEGAVGAIGVGMNQAELLCRFAREGDFDCFLVAGRYTLLDTVALRDLLPRCLERGIAVIVGGVFNSGILADPDNERYDYGQAPRAVVERARLLASVCARFGVPLQAAAVQFPLGHPTVASVLVGCRSAAELEEDVGFFERELPGELWDALRGDGLLPAEAPTP